jgi:hypothetical protein
LREKLGEQALADAAAFEPQGIYDQWERMFYEAAEYWDDSGRLRREQMSIDPERALHAHRMAKQFFSNSS